VDRAWLTYNVATSRKAQETILQRIFIPILI